MKKWLVIILCCLSIESLAQWQWRNNSSLDEKNESNNSTLDKLKFGTHFYNAISFKSLEDYENALLEFEKCININPENPVPYYESANIYNNFSQNELALDFSRKAFLLNKENIWYQLLYAKILVVNGDNNKAAVVYKQMIRKSPGNEDLYYLLAENYIYANKLLEAIKIYNQLEKHKGLDKNIIIQKQKLYLQKNNINGAIEEIKKLISINTNDITAYQILSELYLLNNENDKAFEVFKKILQLDPEDAKTHLTLADYYREQGKNEDSYKELKAAFSSPKLSVEAKVSILISYFPLIEESNEMKRQAIELCNIMLEVHSQSAIAHAIYGDFLYQEGKNIAAKEQYIIAISLDLNMPQVWSQLLFIESELGDYVELEKNSKKAYRLFPTNPVYYFFNGIANTQIQNHSKAIISLEMGLEFVLDNNDLLLQFYSALGDNYHSLNKHEKSDSLYNLALIIDPDNVQVLNNYSYYLCLRKHKLDIAIKMSKRSNELSKNNVSFQDTYAWILYQQGKYDEAKKWLKLAYENGGKNSSVITEHLGDVYYQLGDKEKALIFWNKAKDLGKGSGFLDKKITQKMLYE